MYLGFLVLLLGAALIAAQGLALAAPLLFALVSHFGYIPFEEQRCEEAFGEEFRQYQAKTRRWLGRRRARPARSQLESSP